MGIGGVNTNITYSMCFEEWDACTGTSLNLWDWENNAYPLWFKIKIVAYWRLKKMVKNHTEDAVIKDNKRKGKQ